MNKQFFKLCSMLLVITLLMNMLPMSIFAQEYRENLAATEEAVSTEEVTDAEVVEEIVENRTEYSKEFILSNGLHMAAVYPNAVHYETENGWEEIDNTLVEKDGAYTNTAGVWDVRFPQELANDKSIEVEKDGYTLSFSLAGELRDSGTATYRLGGEAFAVTDMRRSEADIRKPDLSAMRESVEHAEMIPEKAQSRLAYENVYENTDILYDLESNTVKESIILESYSDTLQGYRYTLNVGTMVPVLEEDGQITFYDEQQENVVMVMPAPYLIDDAGETNYDIQVQLTGSGSTYTLTYILPQQWLAAESRAFPVILDPIITADLTTSNIRDRTVASNKTYSQTLGSISAGYGNDAGIMRAYLKYRDLPPLTSSDVVISASVQLYMGFAANTETVIEVHKVSDTWESETITWDNQPTPNATVEDYAVVGTEKTWHAWEITDMVRDWYSNKNTGMVFKASDTVEAGGTATYKQFFSSEYTDNVAYKPLLAIYFRNNNGLESYWDYTASSAGRAGTGYINNFTGNMVWIRDDLGYGGNRMPVSIQHVYNLNDSDNNAFGMGYGWRTNFNQLVYQWSINGNYYVWEDADGTDHYFKYSAANTYKDEDGLELTLYTNGSGTQKYRIEDKYGNCSYFDTYGRLTQISNNQATKSSITLTYTSTSSKWISTITDGAGRVYSFNYGSLLNSINYKGSGSSTISYVTFEYDEESRLMFAWDADAMLCTYSYDANGLLTTVDDIDSYMVKYTYNTVSEACQPYRVQKVCEYDGTTAGGELTIAYAHNQTTFTDHNGNVEIHQFNDFGNTVSIQDDEGHAQYTQYALNTDEEKEAEENSGGTSKANQLTLSSKLQNTVGNVLKDSGFENASGDWESNAAALTVSRTTEASYMGSYSLKLVSTSAEQTAAYAPWFIIAPGETYTFSAYVKTGASSAQVAIHGVYSPFNIYGGEVAANQDWTRVEVSYTNDTGQEMLVYACVYLNTAGTAYIDCVQVEKAETASRYNLIENGDFRYGSYGWSYDSLTETDGVITAADPVSAKELDSSVVQLSGNPETVKHVYQRVQVSGNAGDTFVLSGWAKGDSAPLTSEEGASKARDIGLYLCFNYADGSNKIFNFHFNPDTDSQNSWQYGAWVAVAEQAYTSVNIDIRYDYNVNTACFDGIQLFKEQFGNSYTYDEDGNVTSVVNLQGQTTTYEYTDNKLTQELLPSGEKMTYTYYEGTHNVRTATSSTGQVYTFTYDTYGNNTSVSISDEDGNTMTSTATYSTNGNTLVSTKDALGNETKYGYNADTNVLEWIQNPKDTEYVRTEYTYDEMYRVATASTNMDGMGVFLDVTYTYVFDLLDEIKTNSTTYSFTYGDFSLISSIKAGDYTLATYSYTDDRNNYLSSLDYGNGDSVDYTYDDKGRLLTQTYEDGDTVSYSYDNDGALARMTDSATGITTTYYYDFTDRMMRYVESGTDYSHSVGYEYDTKNNLTGLTEVIDGVEKNTTYTYDDDNRVASVTTDGITVTYYYDGFGRVTRQETKNGDTLILTESFTYVNPTATTTSSQIATYTTTAGGYSVTYSYTYDKNGNILTISDGTNTVSYRYDYANQLVREENPAAGYAKDWWYDGAGNVLYRENSSYVEEDGEMVWKYSGYLSEYGYYYSGWGDRLKSCMTDKEYYFSYDENGNVTHDMSWAYTWEHGRELVSMTDWDENSWLFEYNADGLRTSRTDGANTYTYVYNGSQLTRMTKNTDTLYFTYDAAGTPLTLNYNGTTYYYATNIQGDIVAILDSTGTAVVTYAYDAWGYILSVSGTMASSLGVRNPLRYRGYVYDQETGLYYLQSRYYNPGLGRFINADGMVSTGQGLLGNNMFAYCGNNPIVYYDPCGTCIHRLDFWNDCNKCKEKTSGEKWYDFAISFAKTVIKTVEVIDAAVDSVDAYAGVGLGMLAGVEVSEAASISFGLSYDVIGVRLNDGDVQASQRYYSGFDASIVFSVVNFSEEMYRKFTFSEALPQWSLNQDENFPIFSTGVYFGIGATISVAFDFDFFFNKIEDIFGK